MYPHRFNITATYKGHAPQSSLAVDKEEDIRTQSKWIKLKDPGFGCCTNPVKINSDKFIIGELDGMFMDTDCGIHQYSTTKDEWTKIISYPDMTLTQCHKPSMIYNEKTQKIWMIGDGPTSVLEFDYLKHDNMQTLSYVQTGNGSCVGAHPAILLIKDEYHVIFGSDNVQHLVYNKQSSDNTSDSITLAAKHTICNEYDHGLEDAKCVYIESRGQILTFGGNDYGNQHRNIHKYSFYEDKWSKLPLESVRYSGFGCVVSMDERYVILFGIKDLAEQGGTGAIYVFDIERMKFNKSNIVCPQNYTDYHAVLMGNAIKDELLVHGWLKSEINKYEIFLPQDMMKLIVRWSSIEWVHLLSKAQGHWKIPVDEIIRSIQ